MSPNDVELVRVYTKEIGGKISDTTLPVSNGFEVIVEAEAGSAIHSSGAQFLTNILVRDLSANDIIPATPTQAVSGAMSSSAWPELYRALQYKVNKADLTGRENHVCQVIAFLNVGVNNPDVSFAVSPFSILTKKATFGLVSTRRPYLTRRQRFVGMKMREGTVGDCLCALFSAKESKGRGNVVKTRDD